MQTAREEGAEVAGVCRDGCGTSARERLLEAAVQVLFSHSYEGATSRRIARTAGVNEVTIFRLFGTKDELITQALIARANSDVRVMPVATGDLVPDLENLARSVIKTHRDHGNLLVRVFSQAIYLPEENAARVHEALDQTLEASRELIRHYQQRGELSSSLGDYVWNAFLGPLLMALRQAELDRVPFALDVPAYVQAFLGGFGAAGA